MKHGSLESGIGMFDYAAEKMGWENVFHCEINEFCQTVLKYYWPKAKNYANVFGFNGKEWRGKVDIITCGFPCQPFSNAGKRKGSSDDRHIWPENMRIIREAKPAFVVAENVPGLVTIENGVVFEQVCLDLENEGYEVTTFIIPAVATDKDHRRDRIWIIAYNNGFSKKQREYKVSGVRNEFDAKGKYTTSNTTSEQNKREGQGRLQPITTQCFRDDPNTENKRFQRRMQEQGRNRTQVGRFNRHESWLEAATRLCIMDDGNAGELDTTSISKSKWRAESLKAAGNTIVWEIAFNIFKAIEESIEK